jgi:hypothetical protein
LDDTDNLESRGTGQLARRIAGILAGSCAVLGVTRHQLLRDPRVPYTKNNSSAAILLNGDGSLDPDRILDQVRSLMVADFQPGSDPGLCVAQEAPPVVMEFGQRAQREVVTQEEARAIAARHGIALLGLGGTEGGVIGALAAVGLAAGGGDGRYVQVGRLREISGLLPVAALLEAGIPAVQTADGQPVTGGLVLVDKLRPARRSARPVAVVEWTGDHWLPLKLD